MKTKNKTLPFVRFVIALVPALLLIRCGAALSGPPSPAFDPAQGLLRLSIAGEESASARTVMPGGLALKEHTLLLTAPGQAPVLRTLASGLSAALELPPGSWTLIARGVYRVPGEGGEQDASLTQGTASFTLEAGETVSLTIPLSPAPGQGRLDYTIALPAGTERARLLLAPLSGGASPEPLELGAAPSGSLTLETGIYRAALELRDGGGGYARRSAVLHIYPNLASLLSLSFGEAPFTPPFFTDTEALSSWLEWSPQNTPEDPYPIALSLDLGDLAVGGDGLGRLFAALQGRYVALDLSACPGPIAGRDPGASRPNADRLVSLALSPGLPSIGPGAFAGCSSLASVALAGPTPPTLGEAAFSQCAPSLFFFVNDTAGDLRYMNAPGWKDQGGRIKAAFQAGGINFAMTYVPGGVSFPQGLNDDGTASISDPYMISETEVSWELWTAVRDWALEKGYAIGNANTQASYVAPDKPIMNTWYNCAVWCNALTEWHNEKTGSSLVPAYYDDNSFTVVSKDSDPHQNQQETEMPYKKKPGATGFRLPDGNEWELAARWRWDSVNSVIGYENPWFTTGNSASGAAADYANTAETARVAVWTGGLEPVKSRAPNALGIYDMSGNIYEWVNEWFYAKYNLQNCAIQVYERGGSSLYTGGANLTVGKPNIYEADGMTVDGIRLVCSAAR
jgi:hypothetical protein